MWALTRFEYKVKRSSAVPVGGRGRARESVVRSRGGPEERRGGAWGRKKSAGKSGAASRRPRARERTSETES